MQWRRGDGVGGVDDVGFGVQQLAVAAEAGDALGVLFEHGVDLFDRAEEHADEEKKTDEAAVRQRAVQHEPGAGEHDDDLRHAHRQVAERGAGRHDAVGLELGLAIAAVVLGEQAARHGSSVAERLHDAHATDVFLDAHVELADAAEQRAE